MLIIGTEFEIMRTDNPCQSFLKLVTVFFAVARTRRLKRRKSGWLKTDRPAA